MVLLQTINMYYFLGYIQSSTKLDLNINSSSTEHIYNRLLNLLTVNTVCYCKKCVT